MKNVLVMFIKNVSYLFFTPWIRIKMELYADVDPDPQYNISGSETFI